MARAVPAWLPPAVLALATGACGGSGRPLFERLDDTGIDLVPTCGGDPAVKRTILEVNGNGLALADLDGDGDLDLLIVDGSTIPGVLSGAPVRLGLFLSEAPPGGRPRFRRAEEPTGLVLSGWPTGVAQGDVDGDGRIDLLVGGRGEDALFLNRTEAGRVRFEKRPLPGRSSPSDWTTSVALADADGDGLLDAYLCRYLEIDAAPPPLGRVGELPCTWKGHPVMCGPHGLPPQPDVFLRGTGGGDFIDASEASGVRAAGTGFGLGVIFADLDADGRPDLYVANDSVPNFVLHNLGDGRFEDRSGLSGAATDLAGRPQAGMGVDLGDLERDGDLDLVVTNFSEEPLALYRNDGELLYREVSASAGIAEATRGTLGWGVHLADFDADGHTDLYVSNGHVYPEADLPGTGSRYAQPQQYWTGLGQGRFGAECFPESTPWRGRASARGDLDGDGDLDLVTLTLDGAPRVYLNTSDAPGRQLAVTLLVGRSPALGATLRLAAADGPLVAQVVSSAGFQTSSETTLHLSGRGPVSSAEVLWPDGTLDPLPAKAIMFGRHVTIRRGEGVVGDEPLVGTTP